MAPERPNSVSRSCRWILKSRSSRLQYVRMPLLTPRYITDVIDTEVSRRNRGISAASRPAPRTGPPSGTSTPEPVPVPGTCTVQGLPAVARQVGLPAETGV